MSAETVLYSTLTGASAVTAIVSTRIYPDVVPLEVQLPCVAYARVDTEYETTLHTSVPIAETATLEIQCMDDDRSGAEALANAVVAAVGAAHFLPTGRRAELDTENNLWAAVLTVDKFTTL